MKPVVKCCSARLGKSIQQIDICGDDGMNKVPVEACCEILDSQRIPITASARSKGRYPYYGANGIQDYVDDYIFDDELVLLAEDGGNFGSKDRPIAYRVSGKCWVNNHAHVLKPKHGLDVDYLCYALMFYDVTGLVNGATRMKLTQAAMRQMLIPLPEFSEQLRIVNFLSTVQEIMRKRQQQLSALDDLIKARFVEMFGAINETVPLSYYIESLTAGKSLAGEEECQNKVLKTGAATYDYFDPTQVKNLPTDYEPLPEHQVHDGDIIISRMNTAELVGAAAYVWEAPVQTYLPDRLWRAELRERVNPVFIWQAIVQPTTKEAIRKIAGGTSGSMKNISKPGLLSIHVKKVGFEAQNEFAAFVAQIDKSKSVVQKSLDKTQLLFDSLMQKYFG